LGKYLFFYLKTGGGHLAPAKAVAEMIRSKPKGKKVEISLEDGLSASPSFVRKIIEDGYKTSVNHAVWTFEFLYAIHKIRAVSMLTSFLVSWFIRPGIEKQILSTRPGKIVVFHFFLIRPVFEVLKRNNLNIPVITVVTDPYTAHPIWFLHKDQNFIVFSEKLRQKCIEKGIEKEKLRVFPFVLDEHFSKKPNACNGIQIRRSLGFRDDSKIILIIGGGDGIPRGMKILKNIVRKNIDADIAIVCGKNARLYRRSLEFKKEYGVSNLMVFGYIDFVSSLISISDVVITKCGASTFMEILLMGKVPVINNYVWEQEKGNVEFVCNSKMGILEKNTRVLPDVILKLLTNRNHYNTITGNIRKAAIRNGVGQVSDFILKFQ
jgi:processive 1,2-diacylglycerol beta-glucosyltransferase/1,2-diacylglycerol 3-beta-galactosyltransferase